MQTVHGRRPFNAIAITCMREHRSLPVALVLCLLALAAPAWAQPADRAAIDARIDAALRAQWNTVLAEVAGRAGLTAAAGRLSGTVQQRQAVYEAALDAMASRALEANLEQLITRAYVQSLVDERVESRMAVSANAASTNPATAGLVERSGSTSLAALAADLSTW